MEPVFPSKRQASGIAFRLFCLTTVLMLFLLGYAVAIAFVLSDRALSHLGKLFLIGGLLLTALPTLSLGAFAVSYKIRHLTL